MRVKITRGEDAGDRNRGDVRWRSVKYEVLEFGRSKWKGGRSK